MPTAIQKAINVAGSQAKLAKELGVVRQTVHFWVKGTNQIPPIEALKIEKLTGVSASDLVFEPLKEVSQTS